MKSIIKQLYTILLVTVACLTVTGCSDDFKSGLRLDGDVWVNSIRLDEYAGTVDYQNKAIVVGVPYDYDITRMVVTEMNLSEGAKASIAIGETIDFSLPVSLTVKNGDVQMSYTITVKRDEAKILTFKLNDTYVGKVDQLSKTISVVVPLTVDITQLKGTFTVTDGATVTPASGSIQDFTNPVTYTATYRSAVTPYVVTVTQGNVIPTAFVGTASSVSLLTSPEEKAAAQWMMDNVSMSEYISFKDVVDGKVDLGKYTAIWWHFHADNGDNPPLPDDAKAAAEKFKVYYQNGGNLLLTRYATFYIANLGIAKDERVPNNSCGGNEDSPEITSAPWSFLITGSESHPLFQDLRWKDGDKSTVYTCDAGYAITNSTAQWHIGTDWGGYDDLNAWRNLTGGIDLAHGGDGAVVIAEFEPRSNSGRTLCIGSGCYDWYGKGVDASADYYHYNVEQMTLNAINYLCK